MLLSSFHIRLQLCSRPIRRLAFFGFSLTLVTCIYFMVFYVTGDTQQNLWLSSLKVFGRDVPPHPSSSNQQQQQMRADQKGQACVHSSLELWPPEIEALMKPAVKPLQCSTVEKNWVYVKNSTFYITLLAKQQHGNIVCEYVPLERGTDDFTVFKKSVIMPMKNGTKIPSDFFQVRCVGQRGEIYGNLHSGVSHKVSPLNGGKTPSSTHSSSSKGLSGLNILIVGFDSVSRMMWQRNLPETYKYLIESLGGIVLEGYNIVGDGTPQALLPLLTGMQEPELPEARRGHAGASPVDGHPWIWKELKKAGYITQWAEDGASVGTFTYRMLGFQDQPVDHYMRPFYLRAEQQYHLNKPYCLGSVPRHVNMLNWARDLFDTYREQPKFSFVFHSELSHDHIGTLRVVDQDLTKFLQYMEGESHLDNTLLILMSDHGARFTQVRQTLQGKYEERMPFFSFRLPPRFAQKYPTIVQNLKQNANRLTTPFDIHATFKDILYNTGADGTPASGDMPRGISLFQTIPLERTCVHAGIEAHWCACLHWVEVGVTDSMVYGAANALVTTMNDLTLGCRSECEVLSLHNITSAVRYTPNQNVLKFRQSKDTDGRVADLSDDMEVDEILYQVTIITEPGLGRFEATVKFSTSSSKFAVDTRDISRINKYGSQPHCVMDQLPHLRPYCYCKVQLS